MEIVIACAVTAVLSSTVTFVAYACCVAAGSADRRDGASKWADRLTCRHGKRPAEVPV